MSKDSQVKLITRLLEKKHGADACFTEAKCGPTYYQNSIPRVDFVAIKRSWTKPCITVYEIKVDREDFMRDEKWQTYLPYCHRFYFCCPKGLIEPAEVPDKAGLMVATARSVRAVKKVAWNPVEIDWSMLYYLILSRLDELRPDQEGPRERYAEDWRHWVESERGFKELGWRVRGKITKTLEQLAEREKVVEVREKEVEKLGHIATILKDAGFLKYYDWESEVRKLVAGHLAEQAAHHITSARAKLDEAYKHVNEIGNNKG